MMVRDFHKVIGEEARAQILEAEGRLPDLLVACVGGGSNAIGLFLRVSRRRRRERCWVWKPAARGHQLGEHAARLALAEGFSGARPGVLQGHLYVCAAERRRADCDDAFGVGGPRLPGCGSRARLLADEHRAEYTAVSDEAALEAARTLARTRGNHSGAREFARDRGTDRSRAAMSRDDMVILNVSGRGDKDMEILARRCEAHFESSASKFGKDS
jgi:tryptophan synthase beta chain